MVLIDMIYGSVLIEIKIGWRAKSPESKITLVAWDSIGLVLRDIIFSNHFQ